MRRVPLFADGVELKTEEFRLLRDLFASRTGLYFGPEVRFALERRLRERLAVLKLTSFGEYYHYLRFSVHAEAEWDEAVDLLTTNETYFFREERQLRAFRYELLPMLQQKTRSYRRLTVWSAGCSTGEEAYTIAILIHQSGLFFPRRRLAQPTGSSLGHVPAVLVGASPPGASPLGASTSGASALGLGSATGVEKTGTGPATEPLAWDVRIYGSDISRRCVAVARRGLYGESSFRATTDLQRREFFVERAEGWQVTDAIRQCCHFGQMNLLDERSRAVGGVDAIFCRNVLIYFDAPARKAAIELLYDRLNPGGVLLLGHSESLLNLSTAFELLHLKDDLVYRKPLAAGGSVQLPDPSK